MSTKKINAGDTLTVGDLTDDHLGAVIEVGPVSGITHRFRLDRLEKDHPKLVTMWTETDGVKSAQRHYAVTVVTPPPVVQPEEPTELGQCIRIEGYPHFFAMVLDPGASKPARERGGSWFNWEHILSYADDLQIIVSDPPRWPDGAPEVPERIEVDEWPDDDTHLRSCEWIERDGLPWWWNAQLGRWESEYMASDMNRPLFGPWTRGERAK